MVFRLSLFLVGLGLLFSAGVPCAGQESSAPAPSLKVAVVCMNAKVDKAANLETFAFYIAEAAEQGAHLIVFPEVALQQNPGWGPTSHQPTEAELSYVRDTAETIPGPSTDKLAEIARAYGICLVFGMTEISLDGTLYNASVLLGPNGILGAYRKNQLAGVSMYGNEHELYARGSETGIVVESPVGNIGLMICIEMLYDFGPLLAEKHADLLATPAAWSVAMTDVYESKTTSNARAAGCWHAVANQTGSVGHVTACGHSRIIDPNGIIVADTGVGEGMVVAETDLPIPDPVVDFNGDGKVNGTEVLVFAAHWGQNERACDIAPVPFGDGIVDVEDLRVLAEYIGNGIEDPTLAAHWALDETSGQIARDGGGENDGIVTGGAVWQPNAGAIQGALELDGLDGFVSTAPILDPADRPFSVLAWIQGGGPGQVIISQDSGSDWLALDADSGGLMTAVTPTRSRRPMGPVVSDVTVADGLWHRIGLVWDGARRSLYMDEALVAQDEQGSLVSCTGGLNIGCGLDRSPGTFFTGLIDDVRIYNRAVSP